MWQFPVYEGHYSLFDGNTFATDCYCVTLLVSPGLPVPGVMELATCHVIDRRAHRCVDPAVGGVGTTVKKCTFQHAEILKKKKKKKQP